MISAFVTDLRNGEVRRKQQFSGISQPQFPKVRFIGFSYLGGEVRGEVIRGHMELVRHLPGRRISGKIAINIGQDFVDECHISMITAGLPLAVHQCRFGAYVQKQSFY